jgi:25S rRNA (uracil2634-N3)-methyltransferase
MTEYILLLGEGDLTFAQSLSKRLGKTDTKRVVVATSYDSLAQLQAKYHPEIHTTLSRLGKHGFVKVAHEVDATRDLRAQLSVLCMEHGAIFDVVIFNFPHLGVEDARMHRSMLAHMMSCVRAVLREPDGCFFLTLANAQAERWHMLEMAQRNGLVLTDTLAFKESDWPGYNIKRHQSAKSFRNRVSDCSFFVFSRADWVVASSSSSSSSSESESEGSVPRAPKSFFHSLLLAPPASASSSPPEVNPALGPLEEEGKRRKTDIAPGSKKTPRPFIATTDPFLSVQPDGSFQCLACSGKAFATDRAARTHIYSVHVLSAPSSAAEGECGECGRTFGGAEALRQHSMAVHGKHGPVRPYWASASASASVPASASGGGECECDVCGLPFPSPELLREHERHSARGFAPRDRVEECTCPGCSRGFTDERALLQHLNHCPLASTQGQEKETETEERKGASTSSLV